MYWLHPIVVHFAIALLSVAVVCDFLYLVGKKQNFWDVANLLLGIGTVCAIGAVISGHQAREMVEVSGNVATMVDNHEVTGEYTMWLFILLAGLRLLFIRLKLFVKPVKWLYYLIGLIAVIMLFRTGLLGGEMVYLHGVGTQQGQPPAIEKPSFEQ